MAVIDFSEVHDAIVDKIESYTSHSFLNVDRVSWIDSEGHFSQGLLGNSFSPLIETSDEYEENVSETVSLLSVNIQFALDGRHGNYTKTLGYAQEAILKLQEVSGSYFNIQNVKPYFTCETVDDFVRVEFENVEFVIPNR